jgi:alcohol dehydrogenase class IV
MIGAIASPTKIIEVPQCTVRALDEVLVYTTGLAGSEDILCIIDPRPFPVRDQALAELGKTWKLRIMDRIVPNPESRDIMAMAEEARNRRPAAVIGIGGGSTLDSAKAVSMLIENPGDLDEYLGPDAAQKAQARTIPLILIPTTTGTGSEVTRFGVYTARSGRKYTLNSPVLQAEVALLAHDLVADLPPALVAATGYDALTHALETLWNKNATALSDRLAEEAAAAILKSLEPAWQTSVERQGPARTGSTAQTANEPRSGALDPAGNPAPLVDLQRAATLAGIAFNKTGTAAIHALSFILSEEWHLSHGAACAFFTQNVFDINMQDSVVRLKFVGLAKRVYTEAQNTTARNEEAGVKNKSVKNLAGLSDEGYLAYLRDRLVNLKELMGLPDRFANIPGFVPPADAEGKEKLAALFDKVQNDFKLKNNPVPCTPELVRRLVLEKLS